MRTTTEVFEDHLSRRLAGDVEGDIKRNYSPDAIMLSGTQAFKGHDGVRKSAGELAKYIKDAKFAYNHTLIEGDYAFLEWTASRRDRQVCDGADSFVIKDGKIVFQSVHYSVTPKT